MATVTGGTKTTTSLTFIQWKPGNGTSAADLATINELMRNPITGAYGAAAPVSSYIENGFLFTPNGSDRGALKLQAGDWIGVDAAGWPVVIPDAIFSTSWQHS